MWHCIAQVRTKHTCPSWEKSEKCYFIWNKSVSTFGQSDTGEFLTSTDYSRQALADTHESQVQLVTSLIDYTHECSKWLLKNHYCLLTHNKTNLYWNIWMVSLCLSTTHGWRKAPCATWREVTTLTTSPWYPLGRRLRVSDLVWTQTKKKPPTCP
jgi:hypothetical protein